MDENGIKLQKYIAQSGICSRRSAEQAILKGEGGIFPTPPPYKNSSRLTAITAMPEIRP